MDVGAGDGDTGIRGGGGGDGGKGDGEEGAGDGGRWGGGRDILGAGVLPNFVVFYRFYSIFMYFNAITGYQKYLIDVLE